MIRSFNNLEVVYSILKRVLFKISKIKIPTLSLILKKHRINKQLDCDSILTKDLKHVRKKENQNNDFIFITLNSHIFIQFFEYCDTICNNLLSHKSFSLLNTLNRSENVGQYPANKLDHLHALSILLEDPFLPCPSAYT